MRPIKILVAVYVKCAPFSYGAWKRLSKKEREREREASIFLYLFLSLEFPSYRRAQKRDIIFMLSPRVSTPLLLTLISKSEKDVKREESKRDRARKQKRARRRERERNRKILPTPQGSPTVRGPDQTLSANSALQLPSAFAFLSSKPRQTDNAVRSFRVTCDSLVIVKSSNRIAKKEQPVVRFFSKLFFSLYLLFLFSFFRKKESFTFPRLQRDPTEVLYSF